MTGGLGPQNTGSGNANISVDDTIQQGSTNPVENDAVYELQQLVNSLATPPTYNAPQSTLNDVSQTYEVGESSAISLSADWNQNDAGAATAFRITKDGVIIANDTAPFTHIDNITSAVRDELTYRSQVDFQQGPIKQNNLGLDDDTGRISAGTDVSGARTVKFRFKTFYGSAAAKPTSQADIEALANDVYDEDTNFTLSTGTTNTKFYVAVEESVFNGASISAQDTTNNVSLNYNYDSTISRTLADGTVVNYRLYALENNNPYPTSANHQISF